MGFVPDGRKVGGWFKALLVGLLGLGGGAAGTYTYGLTKQTAHSAAPAPDAPSPRPVANFTVHADGLTISCQNQASGESGWWDFGDGTPLEPFAPDKPNITHTYLKPGHYLVKLVVRNSAAIENDRTVPVEVSAPAVASSAAPQIARFSITPVTAVPIAPATFRIHAEVTGADHCVWDFGDGRTAVTDPGTIDRVITFDKPGTYSVQLLAHNGRHVTRQSVTATVAAAAPGGLVAVLTVIDTGNRMERVARPEVLAVAVPHGKVLTGFARTLTARPGSLIAAVEPAPPPPGVKALKAELAPDRRSAILFGAWEDDPRVLAKKAGGSDVLVSVKITEERPVIVAPAVTVQTSAFVAMPGWSVAASVPLPPVPPGLTNHIREYQLELRQIAAAGNAVTLVRAPASGRGSIRFPWSWTHRTGRDQSLGFTATLQGDKVSIVGNTAFGGR